MSDSPTPNTQHPTPLPTEVLRVDAVNPEADAIARAAAILRAGGLVAFPTETVYGLGANALDAAAVAGIFRAKGRPSNNPLIVHVADEAGAQRLVTEWPEQAALLAARFWPGPLTLVLPRRPEVPDIVTAGGSTVAIRVPSHPVARALLLAADLPVAAPSANRSGEISPTRAGHVYAGLNGRIDLILDGGPTSGGLESTVLDLTGLDSKGLDSRLDSRPDSRLDSRPDSRKKRPTLLRPGLISPAELEAVLGPIKRRAPEGAVSDPQAPLPAPGMLERHYAPRATLEVAYDGASRVKALLEAGERVGWLTLLPASIRKVMMEMAAEMGYQLIVIAMPRDAAGYASELYADLHVLDAAGVGRIVVDRPPELEAWLAIRDRLRRAAAPASVSA